MDIYSWRMAAYYNRCRRISAYILEKSTHTGNRASSADIFILGGGVYIRLGGLAKL